MMVAEWVPYRGLNESHMFYEDAQAGVVKPNGGTATPLEHNTVPGATLKSPYTSWTTDPAVAENFVLRPGGAGDGDKSRSSCVSNHVSS